MSAIHHKMSLLLADFFHLLPKCGDSSTPPAAPTHAPNASIMLCPARSSHPGSISHCWLHKAWGEERCCHSTYCPGDVLEATSRKLKDSRDPPLTFQHKRHCMGHKETWMWILLQWRKMSALEINSLFFKRIKFSKLTIIMNRKL